MFLFNLPRFTYHAWTEPRPFCRYGGVEESRLALARSQLAINSVIHPAGWISQEIDILWHRGVRVLSRLPATKKTRGNSTQNKREPDFQKIPACQFFVFVFVNVSIFHRISSLPAIDSSFLSQAKIPFQRIYFSASRSVGLYSLSRN